MEYLKLLFAKIKNTRSLTSMLFAICFLVALNSSLPGWANDSKSQIRLPRPKTNLTDVSYHFDTQKVKNSKDPYGFLRSFVDLFYLVYSQNHKNLKTVSSFQNELGWCMGDAHPENFGFLLQQDAQTFFTANDIDDSGPCPVALDLYRLMVSAKLYNPKIDLSQILKAYLSGLESKVIALPSVLKSIQSQSERLGFLPSSKKVRGKRIVRSSEVSEVPSTTRDQLVLLLRQTYRNILASDFQVLDLVSSRKVGGGSGGLLRFQVLILNQQFPLLLELKEQTLPGISPISDTIPETKERIFLTLLVTQTEKFSELYQVVTFKGKEMLIRPRFGGNIGIDLDRQSASENQTVINYEAFVLGKMHFRSMLETTIYISKIKSTALTAWETETSAMVQYFNNKFKSLQ